MGNPKGQRAKVNGVSPKSAFGAKKSLRLRRPLWAKIGQRLRERDSMLNSLKEANSII
jgi:hypothetical protein